MGGGGLGAAITPWLVQHSKPGIKHSPGGRCLPLLRSLPVVAKHPRGRLFPQDNNHSGCVVFTPRAWTLGVYFGLINGVTPA